MNFPFTPARFSRRDIRPAELGQPESLLRTYAWMQLARTADNRILDLFRQGLIRGTVTGGQGNEALIVPLALLADKAVDVISFSHRGLGGHLVWSGHLGDHLCQYFANSGSPTKAREGNIHHGDPANRSLPMISHLGIMLSNVVGGTDSQRRLGKPAVGFTFFGDGSSSTGDVHESLNLAAVLSTPVIFVIENNQYAYSTPISEQFVSPTLYERAKGYGIEGFAMDCSDPAQVLRTLGEAIERVRKTSRPLVIEAQTFRLRGHAAYDTCDYMKPGEAEAILTQDPLPKFRAKLAAAGHGAELDAIDLRHRNQPAARMPDEGLGRGQRICRRCGRDAGRQMRGDGLERAGDALVGRGRGGRSGGGWVTFCRAGAGFGRSGTGRGANAGFTGLF